MEPGLFEQVADGVRLAVGDAFGEVRTRHHRGGCKVWFDSADPPREHYEAQMVSGRHVEGADRFVVEVGWHAEHRDAAKNEAALAVLTGAPAARRKRLGANAVAGPFLGNDTWRRYSETLLDPPLDDPELVFELADMLHTFIEVLEPLRRA